MKISKVIQKKPNTISALIDGTITFLIFLVVQVVTSNFLNNTFSLITSTTLAAVFLLLKDLPRGQSLGKKITKTQIVREIQPYKSITPLDCLKRNSIYSGTLIVSIIIGAIAGKLTGFGETQGTILCCFITGTAILVQIATGSRNLGDMLTRTDIKVKLEGGQQGIRIEKPVTPKPKVVAYTAPYQPTTSFQQNPLQEEKLEEKLEKKWKHKESQRIIIPPPQKNLEEDLEKKWKQKESQKIHLPPHLRNKGFTVIETTILVIIIGIIVALSIQSLNMLLEASRDRKKDLAIQKVEEAKTMFWLDNKHAGPNDATLEDLARYISTSKESSPGVNMFYNNPQSLFWGAFPKDKNVFLRPNPRGVRPEFIIQE